MIKNCPFCDGLPLEDSNFVSGDYAYYFVRCRSCAAEGGWAKTQTGAIRNWNMRHTYKIDSKICSTC